MSHIELPEPLNGRVAVAGDWGGSGWGVNVAIPAAAASGATTILHAGDLFAHGPNRGYVRALEDVALLSGIEHVWLCAGNHDNGTELTMLRALRPGAPVPFTARGILQVLPRAAFWDWAGERWLAVHGAVSLDWLTRSAPSYDAAAEAILESDVTAAAAAGSVDVLLSHDAPLVPQTPAVAALRVANPLGWHELLLTEAEQSTRRLQSIVDATQPHLIFHGHMHTSDRSTDAGVSTISLGNERSPGNLAVVDLVTLNTTLLPL